MIGGFSVALGAGAGLALDSHILGGRLLPGSNALGFIGGSGISFGGSGISSGAIGGVSLDVDHSSGGGPGDQR